MRPVVLVMPPAVERAGKVWELVGDSAVVVCADHEQAVLWAENAPAEHRTHAVTGLTRTAALLKEGNVRVLAGAPADLAALVARSALKPQTLDTIVIAWPEGFVSELDTLLAEAPDARRVVLSWNPPALTDFFERHAHRPDIVGNLPLDSDGRPLAPVAAARYTVVAAARRAAAIRETLDLLRAVRPCVWAGGPIDVPSDCDAVLSATLPARDELAALAAAGRGQPIVLALAAQLPYLRSIATLTPLPVPTVADRAQDRTATLRAQIDERLGRGDVDAELAMLAPLFEDHDPALVAAALLALGRQPSAVGHQPAIAADNLGWVKIFVTVGKKDGAGPKDLVGALIKEVGLDKGQIGRIEVKETFSLVEVAPQAAEQTLRRLSAVSIRGRRVAARMDRA